MTDKTLTNKQIKDLMITEEQLKAKRKIHQGLLEFYYFHQYDEFDNRENMFPCLDRWREYDYDGNSYWCYSV